MILSPGINHFPAAIRYELGDHHSFEFVEGAIAHPMDPGKLIGLMTRFWPQLSRI